MQTQFLTDGVAVAPLLGGFSAALLRVEEAQVLEDADARSRGLAGVARTFRPDALWVTFRDGPERQAIEAAERGDEASGEAAAEAFRRQLELHRETVANLGTIPGTPPLVAAVEAPGALLAAVETADPSWLDAALAWAVEAVQAYAGAGVAAIAVIEDGQPGAGAEDAWRAGIDRLRRTIATFGISPWLWCDRRVELGLGEGFDLALAADPAQLAAFAGEAGVALDPERIDAGLPAGCPDSLRFLTTSAPLPAEWGVERARRALAALRAAAGSAGRPTPPQSKKG